MLLIMMLAIAVWGTLEENDLPRNVFAVRNVLAPPAEPPKKPEIDPELLADRGALADIVKAADFSDVAVRYSAACCVLLKVARMLVIGLCGLNCGSDYGKSCLNLEKQKVLREVSAQARRLN